MPSSAILCISHVRIWISTGSPLGPMTVVWSDWYMLTFGIAMKSLKRPATGFHSERIMPKITMHESPPKQLVGHKARAVNINIRTTATHTSAEHRTRSHGPIQEQ